MSPEFEPNARPERMLWGGRPVIEHFEPNEALYFRIRPEDVFEHGIDPKAIVFPDFSVNRGLLSEPEDVIIEHPMWGIGQFLVQSIPNRADFLVLNLQIDYDFKVEHDPIEDNYAHSEVRTYKAGVFDRHASVAKTVKLRFRAILWGRTTLLREPVSNNSGQ